MEKNKIKLATFEVPCPQKGTCVCPKPDKCNGINRLCKIPEKHSSK